MYTHVPTHTHTHKHTNRLVMSLSFMQHKKRMHAWWLCILTYFLHVCIQSKHEHTHIQAHITWIYTKMRNKHYSLSLYTKALKLLVCFANSFPAYTFTQIITLHTHIHTQSVMIVIITHQNTSTPSQMTIWQHHLAAILTVHDSSVLRHQWHTTQHADSFTTKTRFWDCWRLGCCFLPYTFIHTHSYTFTHTNLYITYTWILTLRMPWLVYASLLMHTRCRVYAYSCEYTYMHAWHAYMNIHTYMLVCMNTYVYEHTHLDAYVHKYIPRSYVSMYYSSCTYIYTHVFIHVRRSSIARRIS